MKNILLAIFIYTFATISIGAGNACETVQGEFKVWNGWPPALRLEDKGTGNIYGVSDNTRTPDSVVQKIKNNEPLIGEFCLVRLGKETQVPYQKQPIILVNIISYVPK